MASFVDSQAYINGLVAAQNTTDTEIIQAIRMQEAATAALYGLSQQRLDFAIGTALPLMQERLTADGAYATAFTAYGLDNDYAAASAHAAIASVQTARVREMMAGMSPSMALVFQFASEELFMHAANVAGRAALIAIGGEYEKYRKRRDQGLEYLFGDIETASKVRGIADTIEPAAITHMTRLAENSINKKAHQLAMQVIAWQGKQDAARYEDTGSGLGALIGNIGMGVADALSDSKAKGVV